MDLKEIKELIKILDASGISEFNLEVEGVKLNIKRYKGAVLDLNDNSVVVTNAKEEVIQNEYKTLTQNEPQLNGKFHSIKSPIVGTCYRSAAPDAPPFVDLGSVIKEGETVCIIEAMKLMNEIETEVSGKVVKILVENGEPVEFGQELFIIEEE